MTAAKKTLELDEPLARQSLRVQRFVRRIFCRHDWSLRFSSRFAVMRLDGSKEGEVTLTLLECSKCGKSNVMPSNRTHTPNADECDQKQKDL